MSLRRLGDGLIGRIIESLAIEDVAMLMRVSRKFHGLAQPTLEEKCKLLCVVEYLPVLLAMYRLQSPVPPRFPFQSFNDVHICLIQPLDDGRPRYPAKPRCLEVAI
ncbi:hypothetical protein DYB36_003891 [Aphanomyces astaci]|uniref:F-box domain-containing protein n=1 Tax=Aphanomyces astaci TaxID=112090 RepID=A0A397ASC5_APHAT|nr:hypothetical protein DYB36_003891 [Aphanomyces astaci]